MPTRNVHLNEHYDSFIAAGIEAGRNSNASEAVRAGLRLLEQREAEDRAKVEWLRGAAQKAIASLDRGEGRSFASMDDLADYIRQQGREVSVAIKAGKRSA